MRRYGEQTGGGTEGESRQGYKPDDVITIPVHSPFLRAEDLEGEVVVKPIDVRSFQSRSTGRHGIIITFSPEIKGKNKLVITQRTNFINLQRAGLARLEEGQLMIITKKLLRCYLKIKRGDRSRGEPGIIIEPIRPEKVEVEPSSSEASDEGGIESHTRVKEGTEWREVIREAIKKLESIMNHVGYVPAQAVIAEVVGRLRKLVGEHD